MFWCGNECVHRETFVAADGKVLPAAFIDTS
jgi:hypothetical protein